MSTINAAILSAPSPPDFHDSSASPPLSIHAEGSRTHSLTTMASPFADLHYRRDGIRRERKGSQDDYRHQCGGRHSSKCFRDLRDLLHASSSPKIGHKEKLLCRILSVTISFLQSWAILSRESFALDVA